MVSLQVRIVHGLTTQLPSIPLSLFFPVIYGSTCVKMRLVITLFARAVIISQLYISVVTFFLAVLLGILRKCYFSSLWHTTGLHNWGHDIIIISYFGKYRCRVLFRSLWSCASVRRCLLPAFVFYYPISSTLCCLMRLLVFVVTIPESLRAVSLSTGFEVDCLNCTVLWSSFSN